MSITPTTSTRTGDAFRSVRRTVFYTGLAALLIGITASVDVLFADSALPDRTVRAVSGDSVEITGEVSSLAPDHPPRLQVIVSPQEKTGAVSVAQISSSRRFFSGATTWTIRLNVAPETAPTTFRITVTMPEQPHEPTQNWTLTTFASAEAMERASGSFFLSKLGVNPLYAAFCSLAVAGLAALIFFLAPFLFSRSLKQAGYLRVFHTKTAGDDTLLYCIDPAHDISSGRTYTVLSASGQALGVAEMIEQGRRHCIFLLRATRARAGCLISLR